MELAVTMQKARRAMFLQRTLKSEIKLSGVGLHSGKNVNLRIKPAKSNHGICFVRTDLPESDEIRANHQNIVSTQLATTVGLGEAMVSTVEHLMAAFYGYHIDNAVVEIDGPEVPIMDGSASVFCKAIADAGIEIQFFPRTVLALQKKIELRIGEKWAVAEPCSHFEVQESVDWDHPSIGFQEFRYVEGLTPFSELASARTFGFLSDFENLKKMGLARGASLDNVLVLDHANVLNPGGLRFSNEFVRHKILDALGDLKLAGISIQASIRLYRAGHDLHRRLLAEIFSNSENYRLVADLSSASADERDLAGISALLTPTFATGV